MNAARRVHRWVAALIGLMLSVAPSPGLLPAAPQSTVAAAGNSCCACPKHSERPACCHARPAAPVPLQHPALPPATRQGDTPSDALLSLAPAWSLAAPGDSGSSRSLVARSRGGTPASLPIFSRYCTRLI